jgi:hypothetical protein
MTDQLSEDRSNRHGVHNLVQLLVGSRQPSMYKLTSLPAAELAEAAQKCSMGATAWGYVSWGSSVCCV